MHAVDVLSRDSSFVIRTSVTPGVDVLARWRRALDRDDVRSAKRADVRENRSSFVIRHSSFVIRHSSFEIEIEIENGIESN